MKIVYVSSSEFGCPAPVNRIQAALWVCQQVSEGITRRGHETVYIGVDGSSVATTERVSMGPAFFDLYPYETWKNLSVAEKVDTLNSYQSALQLFLINYLKSHPVDLVHFHTSPPIFSLPFASYILAPKVMTFHDPLYSVYEPLFQVFYQPDHHYITISNAQRQGLPGLNYAATVHNGISVNNYQVASGGEYLLFLGRIMSQKGIKPAVEAARLTNTPLVIVGKMVASNREYLEKEVVPYIDGVNIRHIGVVGHGEKVKLTGQAKALIFPIDWPEPFGLVMIEAMACGTPVVAYARGSVPEIVRDGITGFIVNPSDNDIRGDWVIKKTGVEGLGEALKRIGEIDRRACRKHVEDNFTVEDMVAGYEAVYKQILERNK